MTIESEATEPYWKLIVGGSRNGQATTFDGPFLRFPRLRRFDLDGVATITEPLLDEVYRKMRLVYNGCIVYVYALTDLLPDDVLQIVSSK